ncbi:MAG: YlxR family protein [Chloroflexi bacterium]|nr:YlxR family protein [Chloroflexota bacterium]MCK5054838.1 YlxR family protein [Anaerolineales bacterium]MCK5634531.1 YlxR family protein [Anaerolineales bacterium]
MSPRRSRRRKHEPQRTCVGCRQILAKRSLIRVVHGQDGVRIDLTGKAPGRGAYVHDLRSCWEKALQGSLPRSLKVELTDEAHQELEAYMNSLTDEQNG